MTVLHSPSHPGEVLVNYLDTDVSLLDTSSAIGIPLKELVNILQMKQQISLPTAQAFASYFNTSVEYWLNMSHAWEIWKANQKFPFNLINPAENHPFVDIYNNNSTDDEEAHNYVSDYVTLLLKDGHSLSHCRYNIETCSYHRASGQLVPVDMITSWYYPALSDYELVCDVIKQDPTICSEEDLDKALRLEGLQVSTANKMMAYNWACQALLPIMEYNFADMFQAYKWDADDQVFVLVKTVNTKAELKALAYDISISFSNNIPLIMQRSYLPLKS